MLVLSRRVGEAVVVPDIGLRIKIVQCENGKVRIAIDAPRSLTIHREEVWRRIQGTRRVDPADPAADHDGAGEEAHVA